MRIASTRIGPRRASAQGIFDGKDAILEGEGRRMVKADPAGDKQTPKAWDVPALGLA
jgi:hypothetical protein